MRNLLRECLLIRAVLRLTAAVELPLELVKDLHVFLDHVQSHLGLLDGTVVVALHFFLELEDLLVGLFGPAVVLD